MLFRSNDTATTEIYTAVNTLSLHDALPIHDIAARLGKRTMDLPAGVLKTALAIGSSLGVSRYGPEQLDFLRYRPVLLNTALKERFGYVPRKTSAQAFEAFVSARAAQGRPVASR